MPAHQGSGAAQGGQGLSLPSKAAAAEAGAVIQKGQHTPQTAQRQPHSSDSISGGPS